MVVILDKKLKKEIKKEVEGKMKGFIDEMWERDKEVLSDRCNDELTTKQEDFMIESQLEDIRERRLD